MEALDFAVGLGPIGPGAFVSDAERSAGVAPGVGAVAAAVVGEDSFDGDSSFCEPGHGAFQDSDSGLGPLVGTDLDVGDSGVVIDHGVQERGADHGPVVLAALPSAVGGRLGVELALLPAQKPVSAAVRNVGELGDVDVDHRAGVRVLIATQRLAGDPVDVGEPVDPASDQHRVHCRGCDSEQATDLDRAQSTSPTQPQDLAGQLRRGPVRTSAWSTGAVTHPGRPFGAEPGCPFAGSHGRDHEHLRCRTRRPAVSTISLSSRRRAFGVRAALARTRRPPGC